mgnify:CR=1 FL=1
MSEESSNKKIDEFIAETLKLNGKEVSEREPWNTIVTADSIKHFAYGISDDNPLWLDVSYAGKTKHDRLCAPPSFLTSVSYPMLHGAAMNVPLSNLIGDLAYQWYCPIFEGDVFRASSKQIDVFESKDRHGRRAVYVLSETSYWNQKDRLVGKAAGTMVRVAIGEGETFADRSTYQYNEDELQEIRNSIQGEIRTGGNDLFGNEIEIGHKLPSIVRGPLTVGDLVCWQAAIGPSYRAGSLGFIDGLNAPHTMVKNPKTGWDIKYSQQHEDFLLASQRGMPAPFDNGVMRFAWLSPMLTNWMGDNGFLRKLSVQVVAPNLYGDTTWYQGEIIEKSEVEDGISVRVKITGVNQLGITTTTGIAEVLLPVRETPKQKIDPTKTDEVKATVEG